MEDANTKVGRETVHQPTIGKHSLHERTNENGLRLVDFAAGRQMVIKSTYFMHKRVHLQTSPDGHTFNQIDHCLINGRHFSDVIDARRGANIESDHMLVVKKLRTRICRASNTKPQQLRRFAVDRLKDRHVASRYYDELESELQGVQPQPLSLDEKCKKTGRNNPESSDKHHRLHKKTKANKEWFDEECTRVKTRKRTPPESEPSKTKPEESRMVTN
jgi:hypothetical protein